MQQQSVSECPWFCRRSQIGGHKFGQQFLSLPQIKIAPPQINGEWLCGLAKMEKWHYEETI